METIDQLNAGPAPHRRSDGGPGMTYQLSLDRIIRADRPEDWTERLSSVAMSMVHAARLALDNDNAGWSTDEQRVIAIADTLEVAEALLAVADIGISTLALRPTRKDEAAA